MASGTDAVGGPVRTSGDPSGTDVDDMGVFVDRIAAAGADRATQAAAGQVRRRIDAGAVPPGVRKLAEALAASAAGPAAPPAPRRPADEPGGIVEAMDVRNLVVLTDHGPAEVAASVAALVAAGRRMVVTGPGADGLASVRTALPAGVADRVATRLPAMLPTELRELRKLLAGDTPTRRARAGQELPPEPAVPPLEQVAQLCHQVREARPARDFELLGDVLDGVEPERLAAVTGVARNVRTRLGELGPRHAGSWTWDLLADLVEQRHRATFDKLCEDVAQAAEAAASLELTPSVTFLEPLTEDDVQALFAYHEYLEDGGRPRSFFRPVEQREAQPVLARVRVAGQVPESPAHVELILRHRELVERTERIEKYCVDIGVPPLRLHAGLAGLAADLGAVAAAARSMAALRHDVLFLRADSPIPPPDTDNAQQLAAEILAHVDRAPAVDAARELERLADMLAGAVPAPATAPEHDQAVDALRAADVDGYAAALEDLGAARREARDGLRQAALLSRLRSAAPALAAAWTDRPAAGLGFACFVPAETLLAQLPPADSADVVVVLGAAGMGVERLLLAAVAPRLVAVVGPAESTERTPSVLTVLRRAGALVIRAGTAGGAVVRLARSVPPPREAQVG